MQQLAERHQRFQAAVRQGWKHLIRTARPRRAQQGTGRAGQPAIDLVALTMLAVNRLGPATVRTATQGRALVIAVPDAHTAEIFRAALQEMQKTRRTDRLVDVVVAAEPVARRLSRRDAGEA
jgi:acetyl-CoA carboxylase carboxyltransferase component